MVNTSQLISAMPGCNIMANENGYVVTINQDTIIYILYLGVQLHSTVCCLYMYTSLHTNYTQFVNCQAVNGYGC